MVTGKGRTRSCYLSWKVGRESIRKYTILYNYFCSAILVALLLMIIVEEKGLVIMTVCSREVDIFVNSLYWEMSLFCAYCTVCTVQKGKL